MRRVFGLMLTLSVLQWQLYSNAAFAAEASVDLAAEATYGALYLNCEDHPDMDGDSDMMHAKSYDMFKVACANHIKDKVDIASQSADMASSGSYSTEGGDDQHGAIEAYASLARSQAVVSQNSADALSAASGNFDGVLEQAKKELEAKEERVDDAKKQLMIAWGVTLAGVAGLVAAIYYMYTASTACGGACDGGQVACTGEASASASNPLTAGFSAALAAVATEEGTAALACLTEGAASEATGEAAKESGMGTMGWVMTAAGVLGLVLSFTSNGNDMKIYPQDISGELRKVLAQLELMLDKVDSQIQQKKSSLLSFFINDANAETAAATVAIAEAAVAEALVVSKGPCALGAKACSAAAKTLLYAKIGLAVAIATLAAGIILLIEAYEEYAYAKVHTHLECSGMGVATTNIDPIIKKTAGNRGEILDQFDRIGASGSELEAYHSLRELEMIARGRVVNSEPTLKELLSFDRLRGKEISFKERGIMIGSKLLEIVVAKDAYALTAEDLGYEGEFAGQYTAGVAAAGTKQLAAWPDPETRVAYLESLAATAEEAAAGGGGGAASSADEASDADALLADADDNMSTDGGTGQDVGKPGSSRTDDGSGTADGDNSPVGCEKTGTCASFSGTGTGGGSGHVDAGGTAQTVGGDDVGSGDNPGDGGDAANQGNNLAMKDVDPTGGKDGKDGKETLLGSKGSGKIKGKILSALKGKGSSAIGSGGKGPGTLALQNPIEIETKDNKQDLYGKEYKLDFGGRGGNDGLFGSGGYNNGSSGSSDSKNSAGFKKNKKRTAVGGLGGKQIHGSSAHIFTIVSQRYIRSAYPRFMEINDEE